ncbi:hypothetical protein FOA52_003408 [Chlamydomonas sp. UWO 241]|nr:hypothetical protein FOA52_003408 [Chlamydomonas sp. UWO 241]
MLAGGRSRGALGSVRSASTAPRPSPGLARSGFGLKQLQRDVRLAPVGASAPDAEDGVETEVDNVGAAEAANFERIAASLIARTKDMLDVDFDEAGDPLVDEEAAAKASKATSKLAGLKKGRRPPPGSPFALQGAEEFDLAGAIPRADRKLRRIPDAQLPKVAIVGRPNVGKSAMFNRISGTSLAVVFDEPGITRDRLYTRAFWGDKEFVMIDTGGLMSDATRLLDPEVQAAAMLDISEAGLPAAIERQAAAGIAEADVILLTVDGQMGLQPGDREIVAWLRKAHPSKRLLCAVNKCDTPARADLMASEFWELGLEPLPVSAISGSGTGEMLDALAAALPPPRSLDTEVEVDKPLRVAIVGRPNVGKSSLLNAVVGEERSIVCDMSGTTRGAVDTEVTIDGQKLVLIDTAGIRKRTKVADSKDGAEPISVDRAMRAMRRCDVSVMVIDASEGVTQQDYRLSEMAASEGSAVVVVVNKWDLADRGKWETEEKVKEDVQAQLRHVSWATVVCTTANEGEGVKKVVKAIFKAGKEHRRRVTTATINMVIKEATSWKLPPSQRQGHRRGKIYYATQAGISPPSFVFFVNDAGLINDDYKRYMERQLRDNVGFDGTPLRIFWRGKPERSLTRPKNPKVENRPEQRSKA